MSRHVVILKSFDWHAHTQHQTDDAPLEEPLVVECDTDRERVPQDGVEHDSSSSREQRRVHLEGQWWQWQLGHLDQPTTHQSNHKILPLLQFHRPITFQAADPAPKRDLRADAREMAALPHATSPHLVHRHMHDAKSVGW